MGPRRILALALATQAALMAVAWLVCRALDIEPPLGEPVRDAAIGVAVALAFAFTNYLVFFRAPRNWLVDGVRAVYDQVLVPRFSGLGLASNVAIGVAAGIGEEWLFRGALQPIVGLVGASVAFGLAHIGGRQMLPFGLWATGMGFALGGLAAATGGLIAPIVAHALYDVLALEFIRRGAHNA
jgi:membrane protease YdiL (CAAX protease family)